MAQSSSNASPKAPASFNEDINMEPVLPAPAGPAQHARQVFTALSEVVTLDEPTSPGSASESNQESEVILADRPILLPSHDIPETQPVLTKVQEPIPLTDSESESVEEPKGPPRSESDLDQLTDHEEDAWPTTKTIPAWALPASVEPATDMDSQLADPNRLPGRELDDYECSDIYLVWLKLLEPAQTLDVLFAVPQLEGGSAKHEGWLELKGVLALLGQYYYRVGPETIYPIQNDHLLVHYSGVLVYGSNKKARAKLARTLSKQQWFQRLPHIVKDSLNSDLFKHCPFGRSQGLLQHLIAVPKPPPGAPTPEEAASSARAGNHSQRRPTLPTANFEARPRQWIPSHLHTKLIAIQDNLANRTRTMAVMPDLTREQQHQREELRALLHQVQRKLQHLCDQLQDYAAN